MDPHPPEKCITCDPAGHPRQRAYPPGSPPRHRTIVLCFDGIGESFDKDVRNIKLIFLVTAETNGAIHRIRTSFSCSRYLKEVTPRCSLSIVK